MSLDEDGGVIELRHAHHGRRLKETRESKKKNSGKYRVARDRCCINFKNVWKPSAGAGSGLSGLNGRVQGNDLVLSS